MRPGKILSLAALAAIGLSSMTQATKATTINLLSGSTTLDVLLTPGNNATVGNLVFTFVPSSFLSTLTGAPPGSGNAPTSNQITVSALTSIPGEPGIKFTAGWFAANGASVDTTFQFTVSTNDGSVINDDLLHVDGSANPVSTWFVNESVASPPAPIGATLATIDVNNTVGNNTDTAVFAPQASLLITKDINLTSASLPVGGTATISDVEQGFSTVPLPDAAWMGMSTLFGAGMIGAIRKRLRRA